MKRLKHLSLKESLRELCVFNLGKSQGDLITVCKYLISRVKTETGSSQWSLVTAETAKIKIHKIPFKKKRKVFLLWGWMIESWMRVVVNRLLREVVKSPSLEILSQTHSPKQLLGLTCSGQGWDWVCSKGAYQLWCIYSFGARTSVRPNSSKEQSQEKRLDTLCYCKYSLNKKEQDLNLYEESKGHME